MRHAVITGDIIESTSMQVNTLKGLIEEITYAMSLWDKDFGTISELYRGDAFQLYCPNAQSSFELALIYKTFIRSISPTLFREKKIKNFDVRISLGVSEEVQLEKSLSISNGETFELSGRALDSIKYTKQSFIVSTKDANEAHLKMHSLLIDKLLSQSSSKQCEVIYMKLLGYNEIEIAQRLKVNQAAVNQRSTSSCWNEVDAMVKFFKKLYSE